MKGNEWKEKEGKERKEGRKEIRPAVGLTRKVGLDRHQNESTATPRGQPEFCTALPCARSICYLL